MIDKQYAIDFYSTVADIHEVKNSGEIRLEDPRGGKFDAADLPIQMNDDYNRGHYKAAIFGLSAELVDELLEGGTDPTEETELRRVRSDLEEEKRNAIERPENAHFNQEGLRSLYQLYSTIGDRNNLGVYQTDFFEKHYVLMEKNELKKGIKNYLDYLSENLQGGHPSPASSADPSSP